MKKALVLLIATIGLASVSQAVVIHWAVSSLPGSTTQAALVFVAGNDVPADASGFAGWTTLANATTLTTVSGLSITPNGIGEHATSTPGGVSGNYFLVLFTWNQKLNENIMYAYSTVGLAYNDPTDITYSEMAPATGVWNPSGWTPIPEPCTMSLLCVGAATLAIRRRRKQRA